MDSLRGGVRLAFRNMIGGEEGDRRSRRSSLELRGMRLDGRRKHWYSRRCEAFTRLWDNKSYRGSTCIFGLLDCWLCRQFRLRYLASCRFLAPSGPRYHVFIVIRKINDVGWSCKTEHSTPSEPLDPKRIKNRNRKSLYLGWRLPHPPFPRPGTGMKRSLT